MLKSSELKDPSSCLNRAADDEPVFVLLARDGAAPTAIRSWCNERIVSGKNTVSDHQIREALAAADRMEQWRAKQRWIDSMSTQRNSAYTFS